MHFFIKSKKYSYKKKEIASNFTIKTTYYIKAK